MRHVYQLTLELEDSNPKIWRRISVPGNMTLAGLDMIIQAVMGWTNSHLHEFRIQGLVYGAHEAEWEDEPKVHPNHSVTVDEVLMLVVKDFEYLYDFGDHWMHQIRVTKMEIPDEESNTWPMCLGGANACPPEDVGGIGGYEDFVAAIKDPGHEEHHAMWQLGGWPFDPAAIDINAANRAIRSWLWSITP